MALVSTEPIPLGFKAPDFELPDTVSGQNYSLNNFKDSKALVVMFICNHCPYVKHIVEELVRLGNDYKEKGVALVAISVNDVENYPEDSPENMKKWALANRFPFPYLYDESQESAKAYRAACTPDFSIFDEDMKCVYRGQLDDSRPGNTIPVTGNDIREALENILVGKKVDAQQKASIGCSIKWK